MEEISVREKEVLQLIVQEYSTQEIANKLFISANTAMSHRKKLLRKLRVRNVAGLVRRAFEENILQTGSP